MKADNIELAIIKLPISKVQDKFKVFFKVLKTLKF